MEIKGKIIAALPIKQGVTSGGNAWASQEYVIEYENGQYPKKCCFRVFGADKISQFNIQVGEDLTVSFDIDCREYKEKWYNDINAWKVERGSAQAVQTPAPTPVPAIPQPVPQPTPQQQIDALFKGVVEVKDSDLPF